jgi:Diguanylate cyclase, GGDEF domain
MRDRLVSRTSDARRQGLGFERMNRAIAKPRKVPTKRLWAFGIGLILSFSAIYASILWEMATKDYLSSKQAATNLVASISSEIERNIELYSLSLQAVVEGVKMPEIHTVSPELRQVVLFDRGEEFAVLLPGVNAEGAFELAEKIRKTLAALRYTQRDRPDVYPTISVGLGCLIPQAVSDASDLVREADAALYQAKRDGRDRVVSAPRAITLRKRFAA